MITYDFLCSISLYRVEWSGAMNLLIWRTTFHLKAYALALFIIITGYCRQKLIFHVSKFVYFSFAMLFWIQKRHSLTQVHTLLIEKKNRVYIVPMRHVTPKSARRTLKYFDIRFSFKLWLSRQLCAKYVYIIIPYWKDKSFLQSNRYPYLEKY